MKQMQINRAYAALSRLLNIPLPASEAYGVYMLAKKLEPNYTFELEQQRKLVQKYDGAINSDGSIVFANRKNGIDFQQEIDDLSNIEVILDVDPIIVECSHLDGHKITPIDMYNLDGFVVFK